MALWRVLGGVGDDAQTLLRVCPYPLSGRGDQADDWVGW